MDQTCLIGMDIGGTRTRIGAVSLNGELLHASMSSSQVFAEGPAETAISDLAQYIGNYIKTNKIKNPLAVAVAFPGTIDAQRKVLYSASNLGKDAKCRFDGINIPDALSAYFDFPVYLGKDTDFILYSDLHDLNIQTEEMVTGIYFGTGIGSSFYYRGETIYGSDGVAGEIGHLPISETGRPCTCKESGCCETVASGWRLLQIRDEFFPDVSMDDLFTLHGQSQPLTRFVYDCARVIATTGNLLNSAYTVIGGGIVSMKDFPRDLLYQMTLKMLRHPYPRDHFKMLFSPAGQNAGIYGAAIYLKKQLGLSEEECKS